MKRRIIIGSFSFILGIFLILDSFFEITGHVVSKQAGIPTTSFFGIILVLSGLVLFFLELRYQQTSTEAQGLEKVIRTKRFERSIRRHDLKKIDRAIEKLGTGLGNEHPLVGEGKGLYAMSVSKGGRIVFEKRDGQYILQYYDPQHYENVFGH